MTGSPKGAAALEMERARECLRSAEILAAAGQHADAVSRAYYGVFHAAGALLATIGRSTRAHDGLRALVGEHFVRPGILAPEHGRALARLAGDRSDAEYNVAAVFGEADVSENLDRARAFIEAAQALMGGAEGDGPGA